jgi:glycerol uptake facilitator-like aquaporin
VPMANRLAAEFIRTVQSVFDGCGSGALSASFANVGIDLIGISFVRELTVSTLAQTMCQISSAT